MGVGVCDVVTFTCCAAAASPLSYIPTSPRHSSSVLFVSFVVNHTSLTPQRGSRFSRKAAIPSADSAEWRASRW